MYFHYLHRNGGASMLFRGGKRHPILFEVDSDFIGRMAAEVLGPFATNLSHPFTSAAVWAHLVAFGTGERYVSMHFMNETIDTSLSFPLLLPIPSLPRVKSIKLLAIESIFFKLGKCPTCHSMIFSLLHAYSYPPNPSIPLLAGHISYSSRLFLCAVGAEWVWHPISTLATASCEANSTNQNGLGCQRHSTCAPT